LGSVEWLKHEVVEDFCSSDECCNPAACSSRSWPSPTDDLLVSEAKPNRKKGTIQLF
jgi:hypothetical protein